jgi:esterase/lipase superfamily enzyme
MTLPPRDANGFCVPNGHPYGAPKFAEVETAAAYLSLVGSTGRSTLSSYYLKHCAERLGRHHGMEPYVSNGALIEAAIRLGLTIKPGRSINASIGVSLRNVELLEKQEELLAKQVVRP